MYEKIEKSFEWRTDIHYIEDEFKEKEIVNEVLNSIEYDEDYILEPKAFLINEKNIIDEKPFKQLYWFYGNKKMPSKHRRFISLNISPEHYNLGLNIDYNFRLKRKTYTDDEIIYLISSTDSNTSILLTLGIDIINLWNHKEKTNMYRIYRQYNKHSIYIFKTNKKTNKTIYLKTKKKTFYEFLNTNEIDLFYEAEQYRKKVDMFFNTELRKNKMKKIFK